MADDGLHVFFERRLVGHLGSDPLSFRYEAAWLSATDAFPLSVALPLGTETFGEDRVRAFFFNLLPEGNVRRRLAGRLKLSAGNDYALLAAIGGECAGALTLVRTLAEIDARGGYEALSDEDLARRLASGGALSSAAGERGVRLSLAGAQDKLPVYIDEAGDLFLPKGPAASSHILKFENRDFKHLAINEALVLGLAAAVGLPTVEATVRRFGRSEALVVRRYDRVRTAEGVERLHQEDLCQALDLPAERKYEAEGGPSLARAVDLLRARSADPLADVHAVIRWQIFNASVGNADGHGKNLALLHTAAGTRLAPFYDLVATRAYPRLDRHLALHLGGNADPDQLTAKDWSRFAAEIDVGLRYIQTTARQMVEDLAAALTPTLRGFEAAHGRRNFLRSSVVPAIQRSLRRVRASLND